MRGNLIAISAVVGVSVSACANITSKPAASSGETDPYTWTGDSPRPQARPESVVVSDQQVSVEASGPLGVTIVSLGTPSEQGLWLKTPLVSTQTKGRLVYGGKSVDVDLIPIDGEAGAGSRISLHAMQALGIPLTDLAEVAVSAL
ncbi:D-galactarate dehydratase [uncultured Shimia sp.]|uniref:D-galactarate dehydratase n=1 Tax=uncultured Shimia sp. TaxID=573152 RepID=UPI00262BD5F7|nr:D-galactarate dehydratase [uncultured Shimia sp.]